MFKIVLNSIKFYFWKILEKIFKICCKLFYKLYKIFQKSLMSTFLLNVPSEPKFWGFLLGPSVVFLTVRSWVSLLPPSTWWIDDRRAVNIGEIAVEHDFVLNHWGKVKEKASRDLRSHERYSHTIVTVVTYIYQ